MTSLEYDQQRAFIEAAAAVYIWMGYADSEMTTSEVESFFNFLEESPIVDEISDEDFSDIYLTLLESFAENYAEGQARAEARIKPFAQDPEKAKELIRIAREALAADQRLNESEELVLKQICRLLGIKEASLSDLASFMPSSVVFLRSYSLSFNGK